MAEDKDTLLDITTERKREEIKIDDHYYELRAPEEFKLKEYMWLAAKGKEIMEYNTNDFSVKKETLKRVVETGQPFLTTGCPDCNRPFYNEKPSGPLYNHPRSMNPAETAAIIQQLSFEP